MKKISRNFVESVLARTDIVQVVSRYVALRKKSSNHFGLCPFHNEKTPSFSVSSTKQIFYCFGCSTGGNAVHFLMKYLKVSFTVALEELANRCGMELPRMSTYEKQGNAREWKSLQEIMEKATSYFQEQLFRSQKAIKYLKKRGITQSVCKIFSIGYSPPGRTLFENLKKDFTNSILLQSGLFISRNGKFYDRFADRLMFPIRDHLGRSIAFGGRITENREGQSKYLNSPETSLFHKNETLYGIYELQQNKQSGPLLVTEGYLDVISLAEHNCRRVVATLGTAVTPSHMRKLFRQHSRVVLLLDGDSAGRAASIRAVGHALPMLTEAVSLQLVHLPQDEDPDSFICKSGEEAFCRYVSKNSQNAIDYLLEHRTKEAEKKYSDKADVLYRNAYLGTSMYKLLMQLPQGLLRDLYIKKLADRVKIPPQKLSETHWASPLIRPKNSTQEYSVALRYIVLLMQNTKWAEQAINHEDAQNLKLKDATLLSQVLANLQGDSHLNMAASVIDKIDDAQQRSRLLDALFRKEEKFDHHLGSEEDALAFKKLTDLFQKKIHQQKIAQEVIVLANKEPLTDEQKLRLIALTAQSRDNCSPNE